MHKGLPRYALYQCARVWYALQYYTMFYPAILSIDGTDVCTAICLSHLRPDCMVWHRVVRVAKNPIECGTWRCNVVCC